LARYEQHTDIFDCTRRQKAFFFSHAFVNNDPATIWWDNKYGSIDFRNDDRTMLDGLWDEVKEAFLKRFTARGNSIVLRQKFQALKWTRNTDIKEYLEKSKY